MMKKKGRRSKNCFLIGVKKVIKRELTPLFTLLSMMVGTATFFAVSNGVWELKMFDWRWLIIIAPLIHLPTVFARLKDRRVPYTIYFALSFREGFLAPALIAPDVSKWVTKVRQLWRNLKRK